MTDAHVPAPSSRGSQEPFVPDLVDADSASMTATWIDALRSREMTRYRRALTLPAQPNVKAAVLDDMREYWGHEMSAWFGDRTFSDKGGESNEDPTIATMAEAPVGSPEAQASALLWRGYLQATGGVYPTFVIASRVLRPSPSVVRCLDLGSGVGCMAQQLIALGCAVDVAEISPPRLAFARWRLARRGQQCRFVDLSEGDLAADRYDAIFALDVLAHVSRPDAIVRKLIPSLRHGGIVIANVHPEPPSLRTAARPHPAASPVHRSFLDLGFAAIGSRDDFLFVYRRTHRET